MICDHRVLHRHRVQPGAPRRRGLADRPRHQHHRRPRRLDEVDGAAGARGLRRDLGRLPARRPLRHRDRRDRHAVDDGHDRGARRLRPDHRQRRRHRRDGGPAEGSAQHHRPARRGRQHHQGGHQGLRHRLRRPRRAGAVRRLHAQPREPPASSEDFEPVRPGGHHRPVHRRPGALPVRRDGDGSRRPRGGLGRDRSAPPVPRDQGHHGRHGEARLLARGGHADHARRSRR